VERYPDSTTTTTGEAIVEQPQAVRPQSAETMLESNQDCSVFPWYR